MGFVDFHAPSRQVTLETQNSYTTKSPAVSQETTFHDQQNVTHWTTLGRKFSSGKYILKQQFSSMMETPDVYRFCSIIAQPVVNHFSSFHKLDCKFCLILKTRP